ncbi:TetR/AcrR family transcriptional regulator [Kordiimonas pumila]|uniref:TetR/AcrR family transcriptional regulator n=1 Tax=Kordiimonas pumila TaxID=2161677 RepID=A0ABV7D9E4_9PROT|nr:TetR/AcrR family transcriptional regulator [Kordiimonas pumila]
MKLKKKPSQARAQETLDKIISAANAVMLRDGIQKLTIRKVAIEAGLGVGSIYDYFPNKQALLEGICEQRLSARIELFDKTMLQQGNQSSLSDNMTAYDQATRQQGLTSKIGPELRNASESNPGLKAIVSKYERLFISRMADLVARQAPNMPEEKRFLLATFILNIDFTLLRLLHTATDDEGQYYKTLQRKVHAFLINIASQEDA